MTETTRQQDAVVEALALHHGSVHVEQGAESGTIVASAFDTAGIARAVLTIRPTGAHAPAPGATGIVFVTTEEGTQRA